MTEKAVDNQPHLSHVSDTCGECGSYVDIGAVIDEHDTKLVVPFAGATAKQDAEAMADKAKQAFADVNVEYKEEAEQVTLVLGFEVSAQKIIFQLRNGL